jgi:hypothetical protein
MGDEAGRQDRSRNFALQIGSLCDVSPVARALEGVLADADAEYPRRKKTRGIHG